MKFPRIVIDLKKIQDNTRVAAELCAEYGISLMGVTKACLGSPEVAMAMLAGGVEGLGDSRVENLARLRAAGITAPLTMLRLPMASEIEQVAELADASLNSDINIIKRLGKAAADLNKRHRIILMVDTGDGREGLSSGDICETAREVSRMPGIILDGIGTNVACLEGSVPNTSNLDILIDAAKDAGPFVYGGDLIVSGGNSSAWDLLQRGRIPEEVTELRMGEAILLGRETPDGKAIPEMAASAFIIEAEIIESLPSRPGHHVAAIGTQDIDPDSLFPADSGWIARKASSDHLVLEKSGNRAAAGETVRFIPGYSSLLRAMTSSYVERLYV